MKIKKIMIGVLIAVIVLLSGITYYFFTKKDSSTNLNIMERQWIDSNKSTVIQFYIFTENATNFIYFGKQTKLAKSRDTQSWGNRVP